MNFGGLGFGEILLILVVVLIVFGPKRIPEVAGALGRGIRDFKRSMNSVEREFKQATSLDAEEIGSASRAPAPIAAAPDIVAGAVPKAVPAHRPAVDVEKPERFEDAATRDPEPSRVDPSEPAPEARIPPD